MRHVAVYSRVSTDRQSHESQLPDLRKWAYSQEEPVEWYSDEFTGKVMARPGWDRLIEAIFLNQVSKIVIWRLDRLGRTASGVTPLLDDLSKRGIPLISLCDQFDLSTASGRLYANMLASFAQFEREAIVERINAGIAAAKARGVVCGGSKKGRRIKLKRQAQETILDLFGKEIAIAQIARCLGLSRTTVYCFLQEKGLKEKVA